MTVYGIVLHLHGWWRWAVLMLGVVVLGQLWQAWRAGAPAALTRVHRGFVAALDAQMALGLLLYVVLSPLARGAWADLGVAMGDSVLRFYAVEHVFGMLVAVALGHVGYDRLRREVRDGDAQGRGVRFALAAQGIWFVVILVSIPWPGLAHGRPLLRPFF